MSWLFVPLLLLLLLVGCRCRLFLDTHMVSQGTYLVIPLEDRIRDAQLRNEIFLYHPNDRVQKVSNSFASVPPPRFCLCTVSVCLFVSDSRMYTSSSPKGPSKQHGPANQGNYFRFNLSPNLTLLRLLVDFWPNLCSPPCTGQLLYL